MARKLEPIHPGEIIFREFMEPLELSQRALARALGVPVTRISKIVAGERGITADTALRLGRYFKTSAEMWVNMQAGYDLRVARRENEKAIMKEVKPITKGAA